MSVNVSREKLTAVEDARDSTTLVSADAGVPLHRQLYLVLHDEIGRGVLAAGEALPTEQSLCE
ncbi:MAG: GntR family transcriptional regulator, partial [Mycobacterium sp.]|nr:GntR family transcriptional regulator [Mycobacterium sp.]